MKISLILLILLSCHFLFSSDINKQIRKKKYQVLTEEQRKILKNFAKEDLHPKVCDIEELALDTGLKYQKINTWFANYRMSQKREKKIKFSDYQYQILEEQFEKNPYPNRVKIANISKKTGLDIKQITTYFGNKRSRKNISKGRFTVEQRKVLSNFLGKNAKNPYPTTKQKQILSEKTGLSIKQISNWFVNSRRRYILKEQTNDKFNKYTKKRKRERENDYLPPAKKIKKEDKENDCLPPVKKIKIKKEDKEDKENNNNFKIDDINMIYGIDILYENKNWFINIYNNS